MSEIFALYFHGLPGGVHELDAFGAHGITAIDRLPFIENHATYDGAMCALAAEIDTKYAGKSVHLIGFSLGALSVLKLCSRLKTPISGVDLISAAAPLELGDFLPKMAGAPVFRAAISGGWRWSALTKVQQFMATRAPDLFMRGLFASAAGGDKTLRNNPDFCRVTKQAYGTCMGDFLTGYRREIDCYVAPWADDLSEINARLWHGELDNWVPLEMAQNLASVLGKKARLVSMAGLSHYSTLEAVIDAAPWHDTPR